MSQQLKALSLVRAALLVVGLAAASAHAQGSAPTISSFGAQQGNDADEQAIRGTADAFVKAFNAGDAKTIGLEWSDDARYTDESGREYDGRAAIENEYVKLFKEHPGATITVDTESIRFFGPDIAIEKGIARANWPGDDPDMASHYTVVHARRDGKWVMVVGRDAPYVSTLDEDYLNDLEWLIGEWQTGTKEQVLRIKFEWIAGRNFIRNTYTVVKDGKSTLTGGQIIGWNPKLGSIVSWHFDATGGFGNDTWTKEGSKWVIRATGTLRDGSDSAAVNMITPIDANTFTWQSDERTLDGVDLPDTGPVTIVRAEAKK
jgi:uncharacterized protein (TIGR02246 family)